MKKIIVPLDFSSASVNAFRFALHLAKKIKGEIITVHTYEISAAGYPDLYSFLWENYEIKDLSEFESYKSKVPKLHKIAAKEHLENIQLSHILEYGRATDSIPEIALREKADYVVMGTNGASGLKEVFIGSVTEKIINSSTVPVFAIPASWRFADIHKLLFLTRYDTHDLAFLEQAVSFASVLKAGVEVLQIGEDRHDFEQYRLKKWKEKFLRQDVTFSIVGTLNIEKTVLDFIKMKKINMVIMTVHHKNFLEKLFAFSLATKMAFDTTVSVIGVALPEKTCRTQNLSLI